MTEWYERKYGEKLVYLEELNEFLLESMRTIENLEFELTHYFNSPEYQHFSKQTINRGMNNLKRENPGKVKIGYVEIMKTNIEF